jgi:hypothetical protein
MKSLTCFLLCLLFTASCYGQPLPNRPEQDAVPMLKRFYTDYLTVFATAVGNGGQKKLTLLQQRFCTPAFFKKIPALIQQTDSDPFLKAQDTSIEYLTTLTIAKTLAKDKYRVSYSADAEPGKKSTVVILVTVVKEKDGFRIAALK